MNICAIEKIKLLMKSPVYAEFLNPPANTKSRKLP